MRAVMSNPKADLLPGMFVTVKVPCLFRAKCS